MDNLRFVNCIKEFNLYSRYPLIIIIYDLCNTTLAIKCNKTRGSRPDTVHGYTRVEYARGKSASTRAVINIENSGIQCKYVPIYNRRLHDL